MGEAEEMKQVSVIAITSCIVMGMGGPWSYALNEPSHQIINEQATRRSQLDEVLKQQLGVRGGVEESIKGQAVFQWIRLGGAREDESTTFEYLTGKARSFRHFHDPLLAWDRSGLFYPLTIPPRITRFESSIRWAQRSDQDRESGHGNFSWRDARRYFRTALTDPDPTLREQAFADTFRALGQVMHLIADASVPEDVRNDPHPMATVQDKFGQVGNYEYWVQAQHLKSGTEPAFIGDYLSMPVTLDPELLQIVVPATETIARVPIARLFDSDRYTGSNPDVTADSRIGIAEVANANFVSEDTSYGEYPHPALANLPKYLGTYSKVGEKRSYYRKEGAGLHVDPVAAECALDEATGVVTFCKDDNVWRETARHMLPRAVRYSQEVLDYFFRGKLDFEVYPSFENAGQVNLTFYNMSADTMIGSFTLYTEDKQGKRVPVPGASVEGITLSGTGMPDNPGPPENAMSNTYTITFTPNPDVKLRGLTLVFSGTLGAEEAAVVGKVKPWEPPIFAIQEFAEFTSQEQVETHDWCLDPETGELCWWNGGNWATNTRSKDPRMQRARGHFLALDGSDPGDFIKRIWLETGAPPPTDQGISLRLNGGTEVGREWSRDKGPALVPKTWEIVVDLTQLPNSSVLIGLPTLYVETQSGRQEWADLVWWSKNISIGQTWYDYCYGCCLGPRSVVVSSSTDTTNQVEVSFWTEFIPVEGIVGFEVGTYIFENGNFSDDSCTEGSITERYVSLFWDGFYNRPTNRATVSQGQSTRRRVDESDRNAYARPPGPPPDAPQLVHELRFRRQYLSYELLRYEQLGITLPVYEIELR